MDSSYDEKLADIVKLYLHVKTLILYGEETFEDLDTFLQPLMELRHSFDHLIRVHGAQLGILEAQPEEAGGVEKYVEANLGKSLGHVYRAFFDAADWVCLNIRETVRKTLDGYSHDCIDAALPDYYGTFRPSIERLSREIAQIRQQKDVAASDLLPAVEQYRAIIDQLDQYLKAMFDAVPSLRECERRTASAESRRRVFMLVYGILAALVGAALGIAFF